MVRCSPGPIPCKALARPAASRRRASTEGAGARVLVVDDNQDGGSLVSEMLARLGFEARVVHDGFEALREAEAFEPHVALLDIGLPGLDGYEVARRIAAHPRLRHTRLVAITGYGRDRDRERTAAAGFAAHLVKPVSADLLRSTLAALLAPDGLRAPQPGNRRGSSP